ncbi:uncharacterized protein BJ171DRAFT_308166 [Polychytrium aggregatum]|uniref:uncharacterized protein n=1 Tax=Polychytrium aggregatum TaxID=110093 RepID=UPI0022FDC2B1|nr:uncharacterized protein BJ171DRAFT_308166 [Polychytrium aggregatum]KAI9206887.1 hypothetical protein BJ171DRAFT_308166 [Polychytrium aggregatum]
MIDGYDLFAPGVCVSVILSLFLGPLYFPKAYLIFLAVYLSLFLALGMTHVVKYRLTAQRMIQNIHAYYSSVDAAEPTLSGSLSAKSGSGHTHVFVIPNYSEPYSLLQKTIGRLASHRQAKTNYIIVLAMEASENGSEAKGQSLVEEFKKDFLDMIVSVHPAGIPGEARGKASNVNFAVRRANTLLSVKGYQIKQLLLTIQDADSVIPELYIHSVEKAFSEAADPYSTLYCPSIIFSRNSLSVPVPVRIVDNFWSIMHSQQLSNPFGILFPCSNYSLSMILADKVNYWDTDAASIGEDMHMMLKCFFKANAKAVPIYVPINQVNVSTPGYLSNIKARYVQAKRHYSGSAEVAYCLRHLARTSPAVRFSTWLERILATLLIMEAFIFPCTTGWVMPLGTLLFDLLRPHLFDNDPFYGNVMLIAKMLTIVAGLPLLTCAIYYHPFHIAVDREHFKKERKEQQRTWSHLAAEIVSMPIAAMFLMNIPATVSVISRAIPNRSSTYIVAEKILANDE